MSDAMELLFALRDVGVEVPADGDPGDARVRRSVQRAIDGKLAARRRRLRLPFGTRSIALLPTALVVTVATAAAAGTVSLLAASPTSLFKHNPGLFGVPHTPQTVIPSTVHRITTFTVPGLGQLQYWIGATRQYGLCQAMRLPNRTWAVAPGNVGNTAGTMPGCGPTRRQQVIAQGNSGVGLAPMSVDEQSISVKNRSGEWLDVYYGVVDADHPAGVIDPRNRRTAPLINGRYFVMVVPLGRFRRGMCMGCDNLRAINAEGKVLPANYGSVRYRNH